VGRFLLPLFLLAYSFLFINTLPDFGPTWDSELGEFAFGDKVLAFWKSLDPSVLSTVSNPSADEPSFTLSGWGSAHPEHIWCLGPTLAALSSEIFGKRLGWFGEITARHLFLLPLMLILLVKYYYFVKKYFSEDVAALGILILSSYPRFWADAHNNIKDFPSAVFIALTVFCFFEAVMENSRLRYCLAGLCWGLALSAKANALFLPIILGLWMIVARQRPRWIHLLCFLVVALLVFAITSPFYSLEPRNLYAQLLYLRDIGASGASVWKIMPSVNALASMPGTFVPLMVIGLLFLPRAQQDKGPFAFLLLFWAFIPILRVSVPYANDFDVIRHWLEVVPAFSLLIAIGLAEALKRLGRLKGASLLAVFAPVMGWNVLNHPYNLVFYNSFVGGLAGAQSRHFPQATDYWGSSYRMGIRWLNAHAAENSVLYVGVGEHIVAGTREWLRTGLELRPYAEIETPSERTRYLMFITREDKYPENLRRVVPNGRQVWEASVDGAAILKIFQLP